LRPVVDPDGVRIANFSANPFQGVDDISAAKLLAYFAGEAGPGG
jgi:hypothetical protein